MTQMVIISISEVFEGNYPQYAKWVDWMYYGCVVHNKGWSLHYLVTEAKLC